ncbi:cytochrome P450 709B1-like isoform X1 [Miscanthus floridulus]|uniref:cytochrome P450 709B1-like isoform X1 n=1 Tax=Miscanthus floridulus TaxID=154761 RepID=UPI0034595760
MEADQWPWAPPPLLLAAVLLALLLALWRRLVWQPRAVARSFERQGIRGPPYRFLAGSLPEVKRLARASRIRVPHLDVGCHDIMPILLPPFHRWVVEYGRTFLYWIGPTPAIFSVDLELIKEVLTDRTGLFAKDFMIPVFKVLLGNGLILANGDDWKRHRKVVLPAFNHERIKSMSAVTAEATEQMAQRWCEQLLHRGARQGEEIQVDRAICDLTAEIIGRAAFGTSHQEAGEVLVLMHQMQKMGAKAMLDGPILWHLPTRRNLTVRRLDKLLRTKITAMMATRVAAANCGGGRGGGGYGDDLLGLLLGAWSPEPPERQVGSDDEGTTTTLTTGEVIDECKTFFGAGQETTATLLVWTMFLLSTHPQWQDQVREEVLREFRGGDGDVPNSDTLSRLKLMTCMRAASHGSAGDTAALPADRVHTTDDRVGRRAQGHRRAPGDRDIDPHRPVAAGQGGVGLRRRRVQPLEVQQWRRQSRHGPTRAAVFLARPESLHRQELRHHRSTDRHGGHPQEVYLLPLPDVRSQAKVCCLLDTQMWDASHLQEPPWVTKYYCP